MIPIMNFIFFYKNLYIYHSYLISMGKKKPYQPPTKSTPTTKRRSPKSSTDFWLIATDTVARVGVPGFLVIFICFFVVSFASAEQKKEIIDRWVLLKNNSGNQLFTITVIIFAVVIYILEAITFSKLRKLDKAEIDRLSDYKRRYQELELNRELKNSNDN